MGPMQSWPFARNFPTPASEKVSPTISTGEADLARTKTSSDQSSNAARAPLFDPGEARSQVAPAVNECRMSKSELARSRFGLAIMPGVLRSLAASVEAISIEWEKLLTVI